MKEGTVSIKEEILPGSTVEDTCTVYVQGAGSTIEDSCTVYVQGAGSTGRRYLYSFCTGGEH